MDEKVPYIVFEGEMARHERTIKRLVTLLILTIALLFISNVAWLWFFNQFDYSTDTVAQDTTEGDIRTSARLLKARTSTAWTAVLTEATLTTGTADTPVTAIIMMMAV